MGQSALAKLVTRFAVPLLLGGIGPSYSQDIAPSHYVYAGREADGSGLIYYRARYYDPATGRFSQRDPIGMDGGGNDYVYVGGNPTNAIDPGGLAASDADDAKAVALSGKRYWDWYSERAIGPLAQAQAAFDAAVPWWYVPRTIASAIVFGQSYAESFPALLLEEYLTNATRLPGNVVDAGTVGSTIARWLFRGDTRSIARLPNGFEPAMRNLPFQRVQLQAPNLRIPFVATSPDPEIALGYAYGVSSNGMRYRGFLYTIERPPMSIDLYDYYEAMGIPREVVHAVVGEPEVLIPNAPLSYIKEWRPVGYDGKFSGPAQLNPLYGSH